MDRDIPAFNPIIIGQLQQKNLQMHQQRLNNIRSSQNSRSYLSSSANVRQNQNRKALQVQQQKKTEIERHNLMLFNRMKKIMSRNSASNKPPILPLNKHNRMSAELSRIEEQNRTMYQRIEQQKPTISNRKLEEDRKKHLNVLKFLGKYSAHHVQNNNVMSLRNSQGSSRGTLGYITQQQRNKIYSSKQDHYLAQRPEQNMRMKSQTREDDEFQDEIANAQDFKINLQQMIEQKRKNQKSQIHRYQSTEQKQQTSTVVCLKKSRKQSLNTIPNTAKDIILYKTIKQINGQSYEIKIIRKHATYQINCRPTDDRLKSLMLQYNQIQGNQLLEEYTYDYRAIIERLTVNEGVITLDGDCGVHTTEEQQINTEIKLQTSQGNSYKKKGYYKSAVKMYENASHITEQNEEESYRYMNEDRYMNEEQNYRHQRHDSVNEEDEGDSLGEPENIDNKYKRQQTNQNQPSQTNNVQQKVKTNQNEQRERQIQITFKPKQPHHQEGKYEEALDEEIL